MQKTLGGDRLGSGKKMKVDLHGYERSTHDLGYLWRSTMSAGTLVPFLKKLVLPGDTFDIDLECDIKTHPTIGPLFGSYKVQLDVFQIPIRLYQGQLHNNKLGIGMNMQNVKLPQIRLFVKPLPTTVTEDTIDTIQINPSCILAYLGIRGIGVIDPDETEILSRDFQAIPYLGYWDIYKNYYANKQEEIGYVIHRDSTALIQTVTSVQLGGLALPQAPASVIGTLSVNALVRLNYTGSTPSIDQIVFNTNKGKIAASAIAYGINDLGTELDFLWDTGITGRIEVYNWDYIDSTSIVLSEPVPQPFQLSDIDEMREAILASTTDPSPFIVNDHTEAGSVYAKLLDWTTDESTYMGTQEGLGLKTYQSDIFNNWLSTEWIDGAGGINEITAVDTSEGSFNIDTLQLAKKVYDMLNRIAVSGGSYDDWLDAVYTHDRYVRAESPIYLGGLIRELVFQEVVSNAEANDGGDTSPLGTLAGKGVMGHKRKGGQVTVRVDEPSYIMGIISLTPRIDYSEGNEWDMQLKTMDDLHKPAMDEIGFQELITEQMAWWSTYRIEGTAEWIQRSAGKQPAWINYMTSYNQVYGNFAIRDNEMFMTLNRRYEWSGDVVTPNIQDLTTYIDPTKYNQIFAQTALDAQNFWVQVAVDITARRKMSAKVMPNL